MDCGRYDGFVSTHTLLEPLTKGHPFELVVVDTPPAESNGRYHKNWAWMYTQRGWVTKLKSMATHKQSRKGHGNICNLFTASKKLLVDEGPEFHNKELTEECTKRGTKLEIFPSCSPASLGVRTQSSWIVWSACGHGSWDLGEDKWCTVDLLESRPEHLEAAIRYINDWVLPNRSYSPNDLRGPPKLGRQHETYAIRGNSEWTDLREGKRLCGIARAALFRWICPDRRLCSPPKGCVRQRWLGASIPKRFK